MIGSSKIGLRPIRGGGGGAAPNPDFVSTWDTTQAGSASDTIVLPMAAGNTVDWGDGNIDTTNTHTYAASGTYTVTIIGSVTGFRFNNGGDKLKLIDVVNCGGLVLDNTSMFYGTSNLDTWSATDAPTITTTSLFMMFRHSGDITPDWSNWDVSGVTNMVAFLRSGGSGSNPNPNVSAWVTTSLTNAKEFAISNANFNQNLNGWSFGLVTDVTRMFSNADAYDQPMGDWDITSVTTGFSTFMLLSTGLSPANYGATLIGWAAQLPIPYSGIVHMGGSTYDSGDAAVVAARNAIISSVGGITDGGAA
jgi:surface protein